MNAFEFGRWVQKLAAAPGVDAKPQPNLQDFPMTAVRAKLKGLPAQTYQHLSPKPYADDWSDQQVHDFAQGMAAGSQYKPQGRTYVHPNVRALGGTYNTTQTWMKNTLKRSKPYTAPPPPPVPAAPTPPTPQAPTPAPPSLPASPPRVGAAAPMTSGAVAPPPRGATLATPLSLPQLKPQPVGAARGNARAAARVATPRSLPGG